MVSANIQNLGLAVEWPKHLKLERGEVAVAILN